MPELPEVETIKRQLEKEIVGKTIKDVEVRNEKSFIGRKEEVKGKKIEKLRRIGKMIHLAINGKKDLLVHLKMTGQLIYVERKYGIRQTNKASDFLPIKATRVIFTFTDNSHLYFNDNRKFGWIKVVQRSKLKEQNLNNLGIEPFSQTFTINYLSQIVSKTRKPIKTLLMDQTKIVGVGNIYANEALFEAKILPNKNGNQLTDGEIKRLYNGLLKVLREGISHEGSSVKDKGYISAYGKLGKHQSYLKVYQRSGEPCYNCSTPIKRIMIGGRGTFYCQNCQK